MWLETTAGVRKLKRLIIARICRSKQQGILLVAAICFISVATFVLTGGSDYWFQSFIYSHVIKFENASVSEDFALYGNASCSSQRQNIFVGKTVIQRDVPAIDETALLHQDLEKGGHFIPKCPHTQRVAIIVPYRDRLENLKIFLYNMHAILKRQLVEYQIFVVEQTGTEPFNRATLFNVGFKESLRLNSFDCFIFHDVDLIPDDDRNVYKCPANPRHHAIFMSNWEYKLPYLTFFGGVVALSKNHYEQINGCSNRFWGWGGEDDDMYNRIRNQKLLIARYSREISRYTMLTHKLQVPLASRPILLDHVRDGNKWFNTSGLSDLKYDLVKVYKHQLYTLVQVKLSYQLDPTSAAIRPKFLLSLVACNLILFAHYFFRPKTYAYALPL